MKRDPLRPYRTYAQVARELHRHGLRLSKTRIQQVHQHALRKLRRLLLTEGGAS